MRNVSCHECGKRYDFDMDDFCPRCGSFTQPQRSSRIGADGSVLRVDGINERNHKNSFAHAEWHEENRRRKGTPLERETRRVAEQIQATMQRHTSAKGKAKSRNLPGTVIKWVVIVFIALNLLTAILPLLLF